MFLFYLSVESFFIYFESYQPLQKSNNQNKKLNLKKIHSKFGKNSEGEVSTTALGLPIV